LILSIQRYQKKFYPCHFIRLYAVILPFLHCFFFLSAWNRLDCPICFLSVSVNGLPDDDLIRAGDRLVLRAVSGFPEVLESAVMIFFKIMRFLSLFRQKISTFVA
jgi:hypothetical protein